tara:strand:- start:990 stop:1106 length:117 start_codon:yes stop_codon:yes gene_type:complete
MLLPKFLLSLFLIKPKQVIHKDNIPTNKADGSDLSVFD